MLIGLHGRAQAGKDTVAERLRVIFGPMVERRSFADLLYASAAASLGVTPADLREWKVDDSIRIDVTQHQGVLLRPRVSISVRRFLQLYGTEAHRAVFGDDFWVDQVDLAHKGKIIVVTDARFENELARIRREGGEIVRVMGPAVVEDAAANHASEHMLDLEDYTIDNSLRADGFMSLDRQLRHYVNNYERWGP